MNKVMRSGSQFRMISDEDIQVMERLPNRIFTVEKDPITEQFYLTPIDSFTLPDHMYGNTEQMADRILNTFQNRSGTTGVHLNGVKGSGKTLLAKCVCVRALLLGMPVVVVNQPHNGDDFNKFIQSIQGEAVILFDEFEKVYNYDQQDGILTLLDGVYNSKKLFIITSNDFNRVNQYMKNRPGRIYYALEFNTLDVDFVREYCELNLLDKSQTESIVRYVTVFTFFSFDMLSAVVEEMNRYGESLHQVLEVLNVKPEMRSRDRFSVSVHCENIGATLEEKLSGYDPNEFSWAVCVDDDAVAKRFEGRSMEIIKSHAGEWGEVFFNHTDLTEFNPQSGEFTYTRGTGDNTVVLKVKRLFAEATDPLNALV